MGSAGGFVAALASRSKAQCTRVSVSGLGTSTLASTCRSQPEKLLVSDDVGQGLAAVSPLQRILADVFQHVGIHRLIVVRQQPCAPWPQVLRGHAHCEQQQQVGIQPCHSVGACTGENCCDVHGQSTSGGRADFQRRQLFGGLGGLQRLDDVVQVAFHDGQQLVQGQVDPVVGQTTLREVVGADRGRCDRRCRSGSCVRPHRARRVRAVLLLDTCRQHLQRLGLVAMLAAVVLAFGHDAGGQVRDAHRRIGLVDVLAASAAGPVGVDTQVSGIDLYRDRLVRVRPEPPPCRRWYGCVPGSR